MDNSINNVTAQEAYVKGLQKALTIIQERARFGVDKAERGIEEEMNKHGANNVKKDG